MRDFKYIDNGFNLHAHACMWLRNMGLRETRWILDIEWFLTHHNNKQITFKEWVKR